MYTFLQKLYKKVYGRRTFVVTNNGGESRSRNTRTNSEGKDKGKRFQSGEKREYRQSGNGTKNSGKTGYNKNGDSRNGGRPAGNKPFKKNYGDRNRVNPDDKDSDEDSRPQRRQQQSKDTKVKEQQPDKIEIKNRIEKEKKAMQKKQAERRNAKPARQQARPKRTNNIDWTREYENGSYDDDDLDMYL